MCVDIGLSIVAVCSYEALKGAVAGLFWNKFSDTHREPLDGAASLRFCPALVEPALVELKPVIEGSKCCMEQLLLPFDKL